MVLHIYTRKIDVFLSDILCRNRCSNEVHWMQIVEEDTILNFKGMLPDNERTMRDKPGKPDN